uniref:Uncharacterized protein n=1 Tax=Nothoprocta perdicaria TaxID=30464 RepID=A0A8C6Z1L8_NOTPE
TLLWTAGFLHPNLSLIFMEKLSAGGLRFCPLPTLSNPGARCRWHRAALRTWSYLAGRAMGTLSMSFLVHRSPNTPRFPSERQRERGRRCLCFAARAAAICSFARVPYIKCAGERRARRRRARSSAE